MTNYRERLDKLIKLQVAYNGTAPFFESVKPSHFDEAVNMLGELYDEVVRVYENLQNISFEAQERAIQILKPRNAADKMKVLLARGLNLCAESRSIQKSIDNPPSHHCASPYVWALEKYEENLAQWERDTSNTLATYEQARGRE